jgi:hypothetical protein
MENNTTIIKNQLKDRMYGQIERAIGIAAAKELYTLVDNFIDDAVDYGYEIGQAEIANAKQKA